MNIDNPKGTEPTVSAKTKVRRTFLKRATAGAVLTSLPAHSVWGGVCSVSGSMSGNLSGIQRHKDCEKPELPGGRSPGAWKTLVELDSQSIHDIFTSAPNPGGGGPNAVANSDDIRSCYAQNVKNVAISNDMNISDALITPDFTKNVYQSLMDEGHLDFNMAGVWLNVYFGLSETGATTIPTGAASANTVVEQLISYIIMQQKNGTPVTPDGNDFFNFVDGSTAFSVDSCHVTPFEP